MYKHTRYTRHTRPAGHTRIRRFCCCTRGYRWSRSSRYYCTGLTPRQTFSVTTPSIANLATANVDIVSAPKGYIIYKIQVDKAAWVRIYTDTTSRTADSGRAETTDPPFDSGVITEVITTAADTITLIPSVIGFNDETAGGLDVINLKVTNKSGSTGTVTVTLTLLRIEM